MEHMTAVGKWHITSFCNVNSMHCFSASTSGSLSSSAGAEVLSCAALSLDLLEVMQFRTHRLPTADRRRRMLVFRNNKTSRPRVCPSFGCWWKISNWPVTPSSDHAYGIWAPKLRLYFSFFWGPRRTATVLLAQKLFIEDVPNLVPHWSSLRSNTLYGTITVFAWLITIH